MSQETVQISATDKALAADPAPLGLAAFAFTTFLLSFINAGLLPTEGVQAVIPLAFAWGGLGQILAAVFEMRRGNVFGFTAFGSYGGFWWFYAILQLLAKLQVIDAATAKSTIAASLIFWGIFTLLMWFPAMMANLTLNLTFLFLWVTFFFLGVGDLTGIAVLGQIGGYLGMGSAFFAAYTSFGTVMNSMKPGSINLGPAIGKR